MAGKKRELPQEFKPGNKLWELSLGIPKPGLRKFKDPEELYHCILEYFQWVDKNPLHEELVFSTKDGIRRTHVKKMRAMTLHGMCVHMGIDPQLWYDWRRNREDLKAVIAWADNIVYEQKFTGAAAGLLNASLIGRDLGLAEKVEHAGGVNITVSQEDAEL